MSGKSLHEKMYRKLAKKIKEAELLEIKQKNNEVLNEEELKKIRNKNTFIQRLTATATATAKATAKKSNSRRPRPRERSPAPAPAPASATPFREILLKKYYTKIEDMKSKRKGNLL